MLLPALWMAVTAACHSAERMYKWVDADGNVQYSNRMPPEAAQHERKEIDDSGRIVKVYNAPQTPEEKAETRRLAELDELRVEREKKRAIHDRSLLATYSSKEDMIIAQQDKITMIESLIELTHSRIKSMQERLQTLTEEAASYERSGKLLPFTLQHQIKNLRDQTEHNTQFAADKESEINLTRKQFELDIARYEELTTEQSTLAQEQKSALEIALGNPNLELNRDDRTLLATFSTETDLIFARNEELEKLDEEIKEAFSAVDALQKKLAELTDNADEYESTSETLPELLVNQMKTVMAEVEKGEALLHAKRDAKQQAETRYSNSIERFRHLTASSP
jgi:DNA repair exonuclease SbcCD ATPase subunit